MDRGHRRVRRIAQSAGFKQALELIESDAADGIAAAKLDRITRHLPDLRHLMDRAQREEWNLVAIDFGLDFTTPNGKLVANVLGSVSEWYRDQTKASWDVARGRAVERGIHISRVPPVGYRRKDGYGNGGTAEKGDARLVPAEETAPAIRELFARRAAGESWSQLCDFMDEALPREGSWARGTLTGIISNDVYLGVARQGEHVNEHAHEPIVGREDWQAAQMGARLPRRGTEAAMLAGLLRCDTCGKPLTRMVDGRRGYSYYRCRVRHADGKCPQPAKISTRQVEPYVEEQFLARIPKVVASGSPPDDASDALRRLEEAEAELAAYQRSALISIVGESAFTQAVTERAAQLEKARAEYARLRHTTASATITADLRDSWPELSSAEKATLLRSTVETIRVKRAGRPGGGSRVSERVQIAWR